MPKKMARAITAVPAAIGLTDRQVVFARAYADCFNIKKSARIAGYSDSTVTNTLLAEAGVKAYINYLWEQRAMPSSQIAVILADMAVTDARDYVRYVNGEPELIPVDELEDAAARSIKDVVVRKTVNPENGRVTTSIEYKQHDRLKALELLAKATGMFSDTTNVTINTAPTIVTINGGVDMEAI